MIKSMTGFAALTREDERATITVTIRAVNHRYLDLQLRSPQSLAPIEPEVRTLVAKYVARGRIELSVSLQLRRLPASTSSSMKSSAGRSRRRSSRRAHVGW